MLEYAAFAGSGTGHMPGTWLGGAPTQDAPRSGPVTHHLELPASLHYRRAARTLWQLARDGADALASRFGLRWRIEVRPGKRQLDLPWCGGRQGSDESARPCASRVMSRGAKPTEDGFHHR